MSAPPAAGSHRQRLLDLCRLRGGYLTTAEAEAAGLPRSELSRLMAGGELQRVNRGVYRLARHQEALGLSRTLTDLLELQLRAAYARPCLISALHLHGLAPTGPDRPHFAVPSNRQGPLASGRSAETFYWSATAYQSGLATVHVGGRSLQTYSVEKTLVDLLRYAPRLGRAPYLDGLSGAVQSGRLDLPQLISLARRFRVWPLLSRDLAALSPD